MRAVALTPGVARSARIVEVPGLETGAGQVRLRILETGVCGTDSEILAGLFGEAPPGSDYLILGHETIGQIDALGSDVAELTLGDYAVPIVRRPDDCEQCQRGQWDFCSKGDYRERGIKGLHGFMAESIVEAADFLIKIPVELRPVGVLLEPFSIVEKAVQQVFRLQERFHWTPRRALVLGAGPVGLLTTYLLRLRDLETYTMATRPPQSQKARLVEAAGARYVDASAHPVSQFPQYAGRPDLIVDATGSSAVVFDALGILGTNGVLALTSITAGETVALIPIDRLNFQMVLGNQVVLGTINANREHFEQGVRDLQAIEARWPGLLSQLITTRVPFESWQDAFTRDRDAVKSVIEFVQPAS